MMVKSLQDDAVLSTAQAQPSGVSAPRDLHQAPILPVAAKVVTAPAINEEFARVLKQTPHAAPLTEQESTAFLANFDVALRTVMMSADISRQRKYMSLYSDKLAPAHVDSYRNSVRTQLENTMRQQLGMQKIAGPLHVGMIKELQKATALYLQQDEFTQIAYGHAYANSVFKNAPYQLDSASLAYKAHKENYVTRFIQITRQPFGKVLPSDVTPKNYELYKAIFLARIAQKLEPKTTATLDERMAHSFLTNAVATQDVSNKDIAALRVPRPATVPTTQISVMQEFSAHKKSILPRFMGHGGKLVKAVRSAVSRFLPQKPPTLNL